MKHTREENRLFAIAIVLIVLIGLFGKMEMKDEEFYLNAFSDSTFSIPISDSTGSAHADSATVHVREIELGHNRDSTSSDSILSSN